MMTPCYIWHAVMIMRSTNCTSLPHSHLHCCISTFQCPEAVQQTKQ